MALVPSPPTAHFPPSLPSASFPLTSSPNRCTCLQQASTGVYLKLHIDRLRKVPLLIHKLTGRLYPVVGAVQILLGVQTWWGLCLGEEALQCYAHHVRAPLRSREVWVIIGLTLDWCLTDVWVLVRAVRHAACGESFSTMLGFGRTKTDEEAFASNRS